MKKIQNNVENPSSSYDLFYSGMSDDEQTKFSLDMERSIKASCAAADGMLRAEVEKAVSALYDQILVKPFSAIIKENSTPFCFLDGIVDQIFERILSADPSKMNKYDVSNVIEAWRKKNPDGLKTISDSILVDENKSLQGRLNFEISINRNRNR